MAPGGALQSDGLIDNLLRIGHHMGAALRFRLESDDSIRGLTRQRLIQFSYSVHKCQLTACRHLRMRDESSMYIMLRELD